MSKGKHKRKKQHPQEHIQQKLPDAPVLDGQINPKTQTEASTERKDKANQKEQKSMGLRERIKSSSLTDWLLVGFTGVLSAAAIYQFTIMNGQLDEMQIDPATMAQDCGSRKDCDSCRQNPCGSHNPY